MSEQNLFIAEFYYKLSYKERIAPNLTYDQKKDVAKRISDLTLKSAIWLDKDKDYRKSFPEIAPYVTPSVPLSGLYLAAILSAIVDDFQTCARKK